MVFVYLIILLLQQKLLLKNIIYKGKYIKNINTKNDCIFIRVLIIDWDVHHGQGTQYAFYDTNK
jgi:hypothetical protein